MMTPLNLPPAQLKISRQGEQLLVWCIVRKKQLILTPEEWVRQHVIHFLLDHKNVAPGRINSEHKVQINGQSRRCDIVVFDEYAQPLLIVECKATSITLDEKTFLQTSNYVQELRPRYFWMTNGLQHVIADCTQNGIYLENLPELH